HAVTLVRPHDRHRGHALQDGYELSAGVGQRVLDDEQGRIEIRRELDEHPRQRVDATRGCPDDDDVAMSWRGLGHTSSSVQRMCLAPSDDAHCCELFRLFEHKTSCDRVAMRVSYWCFVLLWSCACSTATVDSSAED